MAAAGPVPLDSFVGRSDALAEVMGRLEAALGGGSAVGVVEGEAGIGKTRLMAEAIGRAADLGFETCYAAADPLDRDRPFGVLADALGLGPAATDPHQAAIGRLLVGSQPNGVDLRVRVIEEIGDLLAEWSLRHPVLVAVEDLHWADESSLLALNRLARRLAPLAVVLLLSLRPYPRTPTLSRLLGSLESREAVRIVLGPLDEAAVKQWAGQFTGERPAPALLTRLAAAGGNPLLVSLLLATRYDERLLSAPEGDGSPGRSTVPESVRRVVYAQLCCLLPANVEMLRFAAVLGSPFGVEDLAALSGTDVVDVVQTLRDPIDAHIVVESGTRLAFRHELVRDAIYLDLPAAARKALHARAARVLIEARAPPAQVAAHAALGAKPGDWAAVEWLERAALVAVPRGPQSAVKLLRRAVELADRSDSRSEALVARLGLALARTGNAGEAHALVGTLVEARPSPARSTLRLGLLESLLSLGELAQGSVRFEAWRADIDDTTEDGIELFLVGALLCLSQGDPRGAVELTEQGLAAAERAESHALVSRALGTRSIIAALANELDTAVELATRAVERAGLDESGGAHRVPASLFLGYALADADRLDEAAAEGRRGRQLSEDLGYPNLVLYHGLVAEVGFFRGAWDDALAEVAAGLALTEITGPFATAHQRAIAALIAVHRNDLAAATAMLRPLAEDSRRMGLEYRAGWTLWARALAMEVTGDTVGAEHLLGSVWDGCEASGVCCERRILGPDLTRLALEVGDTKRARSVASLVEEAAAQSPVPTAEGAALRCRGLVEGDATTLLRSVNAYRNGPRPIERAAACEDAGVLLSRVGRLTESIKLFEEALDAYEEAHADRDVFRLQARLRGLGVHQGKRGTRPAVRVGWASITPTEAKVITLVAEGKTNREIGDRLFISRRTAETHVSHVLAKLGLKSRVELAVEAARHSAS